MATIATGAQHSLHMVAESTYGTTPTTPTWTPIPHTSCTLGVTKDSIVSSKLRGDRQIEDLRHGNKSVGGDIGFDLEYGGAFDDILEAVLMGTWSTNVLKTGTTRRSFTIERKFGDLDTPEYHRTEGAEFNTLSLEIAPNAMVTGSVGVVGEDLSIATSEVASSTYSADAGNKPFDSFTGSITEGGSSIGICTSLTLNIDNGIEPRFVVGSNISLQGTDKRSNVTGSATYYFTSKTLYEKFLNETESEIVVTLTDLDGNDIQIDLPRIKYTAGNPDVSDEGGVTVSLDFQALYSTADASNIVITRTPA